MQSSPPEEFLNLLLNGVITPSHSNWFKEKKKCTKLDYAQLLKKCEAPRLLEEINKILKMDDLSNRIPHHTTQVDIVFHNILTAPDVSFSNTKFVTAHSSSTPPAPLPSNNDFLISSFTPREISQVMKLLQNHKSLLPKNCSWIHKMHKTTRKSFHI